MNSVKALNFVEQECGKLIENTKIRFMWRFRTNGHDHTLEIINSTLSGKKLVLLDMHKIHEQKNVLNIDFDFTYTIDEHLFRISRVQDSLNKFELRIDNQTFESIQLNEWKKSKAKTSITKANDPFSEFQNQASKYSTKKNDNNPFGQFVLDEDDSVQPAKPSTVINQVIVNKSDDLLGTSNQGNLTNNSSNKVNDQKSFDNIFSDFTNTNTNQALFETNNYANNNHYAELKGNSQQQKEKGILDMNAKQNINNMKAKAQSLKMQVMSESLI